MKDYLQNCIKLNNPLNCFGSIPGVDVRFKTKSAYMKYNCESRIRGYMKEVNPRPVETQHVSLRKLNVSISCVDFSGGQCNQRHTES